MKSSAPGVGWRVALLLTSLIVLLVAYYVVHKPINPAQALALGGLALDALTVVLIAALAGGTGRRLLELLPWFDLGMLSNAERAALEGTFGLGLIGLGALILGLMGLYTGVGLWLAMLVAAGHPRHVFGWLRTLAQAMRNVVPDTAWGCFLAGTAVVLLSTAMLQAFAPPSAWDALTYHLVGPRIYLGTGRITTQPDNFYMGFSQGAELVYGIVMSFLGRDTAAAPLHALYGLLGLLAVGGLVRRQASKNAAWMAVVLLLSAPSLLLQFGWPYVDLALLAYGACALVAMTQWQQIGSGGWVALAGAFCGFALGAKYTGGGLLFVLAVFAALACHKDIQKLLRLQVALIGAAVILFLPWAVKGLLLYGNPVYPFVFNGANWDSERTRTFSTAETGLVESGNAWQLPVLPVAATVLGLEKGEVIPGATYYFTAGPWLLTAPLLLLLGWRWLDERSGRLARLSLVLVVLLLLFWIALAIFSAVGTQTRLMIVGLPIVAVAGALGIDGLSRWPRKPLDVAFVTRAVLAITLALGALDALAGTTRALAYFLITTRDSYLNDTLGAHINAMRRLAELPPGTRVRLMWEPRSFYCPAHVTCVPDVVLDHWPHPLRQGLTPDQVFERWKAQGDDYLLLFEAGLRFYLSDDARFLAENGQFMDALGRWMSPIWSDGLDSYRLYTWKAIR